MYDQACPAYGPCVAQRIRPHSRQRIPWNADRHLRPMGRPAMASDASAPARLGRRAPARTAAAVGTAAPARAVGFAAAHVGDAAPAARLGRYARAAGQRSATSIRQCAAVGLLGHTRRRRAPACVRHASASARARGRAGSAIQGPPALVRDLAALGVLRRARRGCATARVRHSAATTGLRRYAAAAGHGARAAAVVGDGDGSAVRSARAARRCIARAATDIRLSPACAGLRSGARPAAQRSPAAIGNGPAVLRGRAAGHRRARPASSVTDSRGVALCVGALRHGLEALATGGDESGGQHDSSNWR